MHTYIRKAQYHETDKMGIIHHSNYIKWMEEARVDFLDSIGFGFKEIENRGVVSPVTDISVSYKNSVRFDDVVEINVFVQKYSGVILEIGYEFINKCDGKVCTTATSKHCFILDNKIISLKRKIPELDKLIRDSMEDSEGEKII